MKKNTFLFLIISAIFFVFSCQKRNEDVMTLAKITMKYPQDINAVKLQASIKLTNINTKQITQSSDFDQNKITISLLKGVYNISVEGVLSIEENGKTTTRQIRGYSESIHLLDDTSSANMVLIFLAQ